ncbi:MAG: ATP-binding protein [Pseudomonadota bacterium]
MTKQLSFEPRVTQADRLRTLNTFAVDLMAIPNVDDLLWYVAQNVVGQLGFVDCVIYLANEAETSLTQAAAWGEKNPYGRQIINPLVIPFGHGITGQVAQTRQAVIVGDLLQDSNYIADTQPARSEICVPLMSGDRVLGVIDSEDPELDAFGEAEQEILSTVAAMTSAKMQLLAETRTSQRRYQDLMEAHAQLTNETSNRKALEAELFEARKLEAVGRLTGKFAHEFNGLLTAISGNAELLELSDAASTPEAQESLDNLKTSAAKGAKLIQDMLAFAQKTRLSPQEVNLNSLVLAACGRFDAPIRSAIETDLQGDLWPITVDPSAAQNIVAHLARNGIEANGPDGALKIKTENLFYTFAEARRYPSDLTPGRYVRLSVTDQGDGIPESQLNQIFDPFFTTKNVGAGTGLGLSVVLGVMRQSGGTVNVRSHAGEGATFELYFPARARTPMTPAEHRSAPGPR